MAAVAAGFEERGRAVGMVVVVVFLDTDGDLFVVAM